MVMGQMGQGLSIMPSAFVEGGGAPVDQNLRITGAVFCVWDYNGKSPATVAAQIKLQSDDGQEHIQYYSVGDPAKYAPTPDGQSVVTLGSAQGIVKSSNFAKLVTAIVNCGFPEARLTSISSLVGLYAYWIGQVQEKRPGLANQKEGGIIAVPKQIIQMPGEAPTQAAAAVIPGVQVGGQVVGQQVAGQQLYQAPPVIQGQPVVQGAVVQGQPVADPMMAEALRVVQEVLGKSQTGTCTRQDVAVHLFSDPAMAQNPIRDAISTAVFSPNLPAALGTVGLKLTGEVISR